ncbi:MAG: hypothetical protein ACKOXT_04735, partial [Actinomycetota bacterium]
AQFLKAAKASDKKWWSELYAPKELNPGKLEVEGNYRRFLKANLIIRISSSATKLEVNRVLAAIDQSGFDYPISLDPGSKIKLQGKNVTIEDSNSFEARVVDNPTLGLRIWQLGAIEPWVRIALPKPDIHVISGEVLLNGRLTGLNLVREQAVSITQHRFGALQPRIL